MLKDTGHESTPIQISDLVLRRNREIITFTDPFGKEFSVLYTPAEQHIDVQIARRETPFGIIAQTEDIPVGILELIATGNTTDLRPQIDPLSPRNPTTRSLTIDTGEKDLWILNGVGYAKHDPRKGNQTIFSPPSPRERVIKHRKLGTTTILIDGTVRNKPNREPLGMFSSNMAGSKYENTENVRDLAENAIQIPKPVCWGRYKNLKGSFFIYKKPRNSLSLLDLAEINVAFIERHHFDPLIVEIAAINLMQSVGMLHRANIAHWQLHLKNCEYILDGNYPWVYIGDWETCTDLSHHPTSFCDMKRHRRQPIQFQGLDGKLYKPDPRTLAKVIDASKAIRAIATTYNHSDIVDPITLYDCIASAGGWAYEGYLVGIGLKDQPSSTSIQNMKSILMNHLIYEASNGKRKHQPQEIVAAIIQQVLGDLYMKNEHLK